jgi:hypothetical protein
VPMMMVSFQHRAYKLILTYLSSDKRNEGIAIGFINIRFTRCFSFFSNDSTDCWENRKYSEGLDFVLQADQ